MLLTVFAGKSCGGETYQKIPPLANRAATALVGTADDCAPFCNHRTKPIKCLHAQKIRKILQPLFELRKSGYDGTPNNERIGWNCVAAISPRWIPARTRADRLGR